jgi:hypothetical protein
MTTARYLMIVSEALAGVALISSILLPKNLDLGVRVSSQMGIGIPVRWFVPLFLIVMAGLTGAGSLMKMYWSLAHHG